MSLIIAHAIRAIVFQISDIHPDVFDYDWYNRIPDAAYLGDFTLVRS
jgi:hypothetical protein